MGGARLGRFSASGLFLDAWGTYGSGEGEFRGPYDVAVGPGGNVYVTDHNNSRIQYFTGLGSFLGAWGSSGSGDGEFDYPAAVAASDAGPIYVTDAGIVGKAGNERVQVFTRAGAFLGKWGKAGSGDGQFNIPNGVDVAADGTVYVADSENHRIVYYR
jgi:tripartite motif-containing protein 71